jgi:hypothetical protein
MAFSRPRVRDVLQKLRSETPQTFGKGALRCYYKPFRRVKRTFNAKSAARVVCAAIRDGATKAEIRQEMSRCLVCSEDDQQKRVLDQAMEAVAASSSMLATMISLIGALVAVIAAVRLVGRFVPQARLALLVLTPAFARIEGFLSTIIARKAANDALFIALRRAA